MKQTIFLSLLIAVIMLHPYQSEAQSTLKIENVIFEIQNDIMVVTYDLLNDGKNELFKVILTITIPSGKKIIPVSVSGDVGPMVYGGKGKKILWDIMKDNIGINEGALIYVDVIAKIFETQVPSYPKEKYLHKGTALLFSAIVPGLGITKLNKGKPFWLMAIAFYGSAAGSYIYYNSANKTFDKYMASEDENERNKFYSQAETEQTISTVLMYTAGALWLGNMIWTAVHPNKTKPGKNRISLGGGWNERFGGAELSVKYSF